ncbi:hypothetical protein ATANTOWER_002881 [Ataeniobius toweri]|uniref:Uncharacterized protein n=1 Tax=Ataeniobius toweri TaxID=208326 RepID=A0ABU7AWB1_9TELE|nr:hypothetical protein [Ataeniobius toweri]
MRNQEGTKNRCDQEAGRQREQDYGKELEERLTQNLWRGLKNISGFGQSVRGIADGDQSWADELNCYFNRFSFFPHSLCPLSDPPSSHISSPTDTPPFPRLPSSTATSSTPMPPTHPMQDCLQDQRPSAPHPQQSHLCSS